VQRVLACYSLVALIALPLAACQSSDKRRVEREDASGHRACPGPHEMSDAARTFAKGVATTDLPETRSKGVARVACRASQMAAPRDVDKARFAEEVTRALEETGAVTVLRGTEGIEADYNVRGDVRRTESGGCTILLELVDARTGHVRLKAPRAYAKALDSPPPEERRPEERAGETHH
jgi:hypothetical protein